MKLFLFIITTIVLVVICLSTLMFIDNDFSRYVRFDLKQILTQRLVCIDEWPESKKFDAMYILGGSSVAQKYKFEVASRIYQQKICRNIIFMSLQGVTRYSRDLARNLTNNEWSILKMEKLGIPSSDVKAVFMEHGLLGTMNEAENISKLALRNKYKSLLLIAAPYHSRRVRLSFNNFIKGSDLKFIILGSGENVYLRSLVFEWIKLKLYQIFIFLNQ